MIELACKMLPCQITLHNSCWFDDDDARMVQNWAPDWFNRKAFNLSSRYCKCEPGRSHNHLCCLESKTAKLVMFSEWEGWYCTLLLIKVTLANCGCLWVTKCGRSHIPLPSQCVRYAVQKDAVFGFTCLRGHMYKSSPSSTGSWHVQRGEQASGLELANNQMEENGGKERLRTTRKRSIQLF